MRGGKLSAKDGVDLAEKLYRSGGKFGISEKGVNFAVLAMFCFVDFEKIDACQPVVSDSGRLPMTIAKITSVIDQWTLCGMDDD